MVWVNPVTGEKAFMVHDICARKLFLRSFVDEEATVVEDVEAIRAFLGTIQSRMLKPELILIPELDEGEIAIWANYQVFHTAIDYPDAYGPRSMHQANIVARKGPVGPVAIPAVAA